MVLRAEAEVEHVGETSIGVDHVSIRVIDVLRGDAPSLGDAQDDVAVVAVAGNVEHAVNRNSE